MGLKDQRAKLLGKLESRISTGKDPEGWLEDLKGNLDKSIDRHGIDSNQSQKWRLLVCDQLQALGRYDEEKFLWEAQADSLRRTKGPDDVDTVGAEGRLALDLGLLGDYARARVILQHVYDVLVQKLEPGDQRTDWARRQIEMIDEAFDSDD
jgi:hypothetical protein